MQYKTHQSFTSLLEGNYELQKVVSKVHHLEELNTLLASKLDPSFVNHCRVANLRDGILILATTSPAWNHKLRFSSLDLLSQLRAEPRWSGLKSIEIRVDYLPNMESASPQVVSRRAPLSKANAKLFEQLGENVSNPKLAAALKRLAQTSES